jgi:hypothetical protein
LLEEIDLLDLHRHVSERDLRGIEPRTSVAARMPASVAALPLCGLCRLAPKAAAGITGAVGYSVRNLQSRYTLGAKTGKQARRTTYAAPSASMNLAASSDDTVIVRRIDLETDMTLFSPTVLYPPIAMHDRRVSSDIAFGAWAAVVLIGLAIVSVTLGVAPVVDPTMFPVP